MPGSVIAQRLKTKTPTTGTHGCPTEGRGAEQRRNKNLTRSKPQHTVADLLPSLRNVEGDQRAADVERATGELAPAVLGNLQREKGVVELHAGHRAGNGCGNRGRRDLLRLPRETEAPGQDLPGSGGDRGGGRVEGSSMDVDRRHGGRHDMAVVVVGVGVGTSGCSRQTALMWGEVCR